jgi:glucose dehydrogenase
MAEIQRRDLMKGAAVAAVGVALTGGVPAVAEPTTAGHHRPPVALTPGGRDFPKVGGNLGNQNYTALDGIRRGNVRELGATWVNRIEGGLSSGNSQSTAVAVDGVLYIESALGNVFAVDGATGTTKWVYRQTRGSLTRRGVAVGDGKVFTHGKGNWIIALDRETGAVVWERRIDGYGNMEKVAVIFHDGQLFCGTADGDRAAGLSLDASDGDLIWHFWGAPGTGEIGNDTWEGDSWQTGGCTPWIHPAVDPDLGLVYWAFGNARGNRSSQDGSERAGQNLFSSSLVAIDMKTGAYRWHFQSIHHGIWDMDNTMAPVLADVRIHGRPRKIVIYGSKCGMYYILDRETGEAPLGIDEIPVPQDPRQKTWPTQPFPRPRCPTTGRARSTPRTGTSRCCPSPATAAARTGTTSPSATAPAASTPGSGTSRPHTR